MLGNKEKKSFHDGNDKSPNCISLFILFITNLCGRNVLYHDERQFAIRFQLLDSIACSLFLFNFASNVPSDVLFRFIIWDCFFLFLCIYVDIGDLFWTGLCKITTNTLCKHVGHVATFGHFQTTAANSAEKLIMIRLNIVFSQSGPILFKTHTTKCCAQYQPQHIKYFIFSITIRWPYDERKMSKPVFSRDSVVCRK